VFDSVSLVRGKLSKPLYSVTWIYLLITACIFYLSACVTVKKPNINEKFLENASCQELQAELVRVGKVRSYAEKEQEITGTQVAAGLLLGGIGMAVNEERAKDMDKDSQAALKKIYTYWDRNNCAEEIYRKNKR